MQQDNKYAGFFIRMAAHLIDTAGIILLLYIFSLLIIKTPSLEGISNYKYISTKIVYWLSTVMLCAPLAVLYSSYFISKFGGTLGMLLLRIKVIDVQTGLQIDFKKSFYRIIIGHGFSGKFFGLGYISMIKHPQKQTWHDQLFETYVIRQ